MALSFLDRIWKGAHEDMARDLRAAIDGDMEMARTIYWRSTTNDDPTTFEEFLEKLPAMLQYQEQHLKEYENKANT